MKVYVRAPYAEECLEELRNTFGEVLYEPWTKDGNRYYEDEMLEKLLEHKPEIFITELDRITEKVLQGYKGLKVIGDCRAKPANIQVDACTRHGIPVLCTPARNAQAVAEMLIGLVLYYYRHIGPGIQWVKDGEWTAGTTPYFTWRGHEIAGKKVGLVALGAVAQKAAALFTAFGAEVSYYDPYVDSHDLYEKKTLQEIFATSDIVSLHLPVTEETTGLIDRELLFSMKPDALLVNTARSEVVDNEALYQLMQEKRIGGLLLDVLEKEPPEPSDLAIAALDRVVLTPHIAGATYEVTDHQSRIMNERLLQWAKNQNLEKIVFNREVL